MHILNGRLWPRLLAVFGILTLLLGTVALQAGSANAVQTSQPGIVSADPADYTPDVMNGSVKTIVQVGNRIVVGGSFSQIRERGQNKPTLDQSNIFAFDPITGAIDRGFSPDLDDEVEVLLPASDGSVIAAGHFTKVNGVTSRKLTRLTMDGQIRAGFKPDSISADVLDARLVGGELIIAGRFQKIGQTTRTSLASVNPDTGKLTDFLSPVLGSPNSDVTSVLKIDVTPDGSRLVAIGNFSTVDGKSRPQIAMFDTSGAAAAVSSNWRTAFFDVTKCGKRFTTYVRDIDIDPSGTYMVVTTTGGYGGSDSPCDVIARFEVGATVTGESGSVPTTWRNYTGGDTSYAVAITGEVVYVGGHQRWFNNPWAGDRAGTGAVARAGLAALDPKSGLPFKWDPGRDRGVGVFDIYATDAGIYIGNDTEWVAGEQRRRLAFFPLQGGSAVPAGKVGTLANDVYLVGDGAGGLPSTDVVRRTFYSGSGAPGAVDVTTNALNGPSNWRDARGATLIDNTVYTAWSDGTLRAHPFNGIQFGTSSNVELNAGGTGSTNNFAVDASKVTSMFFDPTDNRLYYTMTGDSTLCGSSQGCLWWRAFNPESQVVGAARFKASGTVSTLNPSRVRGMFLSGESLYFADNGTGNLFRVGFSKGTVSGTPTRVDTTIDWRARGAFVWNGAPAQALADPVADFTATCAGLTCEFDGTTSTDSDGVVTAWAWNFGDGSTGTGSVATRKYATAGTYPVTLKVTDNRGQSGPTGTVVRNVTVSPAASVAVGLRPGAVDSASANAVQTSIKIPASVMPGDFLILMATINTEAAVDSVPAGWTLAADQASSGMAARMFTRVAAEGDAGTTVTVRHSATSKTDLTIAAYTGVDAANPILQLRGADETAVTATHTTPGVALEPRTRFVVSYWADKSSSTTQWTYPKNGASAQTLVAESTGVGPGRISSLTTYQAVAPAPSGSVPGIAATAQDGTSPSSSKKAMMFSVSLRQAGL